MPSSILWTEQTWREISTCPTQLMELEIPVIMAVNMMDVVKKNGDRINVKALEEEFARMTKVLDVEDIIKKVEDSMDDDAESIITNERYTYITSIIGRRRRKNRKNFLDLYDGPARTVRAQAQKQM